MKQEGLNEKYVTQNLTRMEQHVFPLIGSLPITDITIPDVVEVVEAISKRGTIETAKRMKQLIGQVFRYAAQRGLCVHNPAGDLRDILPTQEERHHACIPPSELPKLIAKIEARDNDFTKYAMKLLMLTFVRTSELIGATWAEIDWDKEEWHIPKERMKMKRPHVVPLSGDAGDDTIDGGYGDDSITGGAGNDLILGNLGNDTITGDDGSDTLFGDAGNDTIYGGNASDFIDGGAGTDLLYGDNGNDVIVGRDGDDVLLIAANDNEVMRALAA